MMVRWSVIAVLLGGLAGLTVWGAHWLSQPVEIVNQPIPPNQGRQVLTPQGAAPAASPGAQPVIAPGAQPIVAPGAQPVAGGKLDYRPAGTIGGEPVFQKDLAGLAIDGPRGLLYAAGDQQVKSFRLAGSGGLVRQFSLRRPPLSVAVDPDGNLYVGESGRIEKYSPDGNRLAKIADGQVGEVTAVAVRGRELLAGDAKARLIRRYDINDNFKHLGDVPSTTIDLVPTNPSERLLLPNRTLDFAVAPDGRLIVANPGRHLVQLFDPAGKLAAKWGRFDIREPADFTGCCNPTNVAALPLSSVGRPGLTGLGVVTAEKTLARVKVYDASGRLLCLIDVNHFDQQNTRMDLAVDPDGRIYVADTRPRIIRRFDPQK